MAATKPTLPRLVKDQPLVQTAVQALALELERAKGDLSAHEDICGERYKGIEAAIGDVKRQLELITGRLGSISDAQVASAAVAAAALTSGRPKWWATLMGGAVLAVFGWMASTIWSMENAKVDAAQNRPAAAITVNPSVPEPVAPVIQAPPATPTPEGTVQQAQ